LGGKGHAVYAHGNDYPKKEGKMPDGADTTARGKAHGQKGCTKGKECSGTEAIDEGSCHYRKEGMHYHSQ
jgi:hypothetical protein